MGTGYRTFVQLKKKAESATIYIEIQIVAFFKYRKIGGSTWQHKSNKVLRND